MSRTSRPSRADPLLVRLASDDERRAQAHGPLHSGDLRCERTFGPRTSFHCACGRHTGPRHPVAACEHCCVEVIDSDQRRTRVAYLELPVAVPPPLSPHTMMRILPVLGPAARPGDLEPSCTPLSVQRLLALDTETRGETPVTIDPQKMQRFLDEFDANEPAPRSSIVAFEDQAGYALPSDYVQFLSIANGGEGSIGVGYAALWRVEELLVNNAAYGVTEWAPQLLVFGNNGGSESFAFDRVNGWQILVVPFIGFDPDESLLRSPSFLRFLEDLYVFGLQGRPLGPGEES